MATRNPGTVVRNPGRMVIDPTDLSTTYPYGGTEIGLVREKVFEPLGQPYVVWNEGLGEATDVLEGSNEWLFTCFLRGVNDDVKSSLLTGWRSAGGTSSHGLLTGPSAKAPGESLLDYAQVKLLFVPYNLIDHDALIMYRAIPWWSEGAEIMFGRNEEYGFPLSFRCLRNSSNHTHQFGRLADLSLT